MGEAPGNATRAYGKSRRGQDRLREFTRQCVFLRDGLLLVFDRVEPARPEIEARWLAHFVGKPEITGRLVKTEVKGHIEDFEGTVAISQGRKGAVVRCQTLFPQNPIIRRIGGAILDVPTSSLVPVPKSQHQMGMGLSCHWNDPLVLNYRDPITGKDLGALLFEARTLTDVNYEVTRTHLNIEFHFVDRGLTLKRNIAFADFPSLLSLLPQFEARKWPDEPVLLHANYLPGYEYYHEGVNYGPYYAPEELADTRTRAPELRGAPNDYGSWRIEVSPTRKAERVYFLHALRILPWPNEEPGEIHCTEGPNHAEATIKLKGKTYAVTLPKTGKPGGHIRIASASGETLADREFARVMARE
ncbi:MAG: hypothetical protein FJ290_06215 [Planctomycetes bacterium]|nr:hypothetical protein [Planctomycetota bacterium]